MELKFKKTFRKLLDRFVKHHYADRLNEIFSKEELSKELEKVRNLDKFFDTFFEPDVVDISKVVWKKEINKYGYIKE